MWVTRSFEHYFFQPTRFPWELKDSWVQDGEAPAPSAPMAPDGAPSAFRSARSDVRRGRRARRCPRRNRGSAWHGPSRLGATPRAQGKRLAETWGPKSIWLWVKTDGIPFWGFRCTTHFRTYFSGWIGMFTGGTIWTLTHGQYVSACTEHKDSGSSPRCRYDWTRTYVTWPSSNQTLQRFSWTSLEMAMSCNVCGPLLRPPCFSAPHDSRVTQRCCLRDLTYIEVTCALLDERNLCGKKGLSNLARKDLFGFGQFTF